MALENEEIDLIFGKNMLDADAISQYVDSDRFTVSLSDPTSTRHIVLNTTHDILGDVAVAKGAPARHEPAGHLRGHFLRPGAGSGYPLFPNRPLL